MRTMFIAILFISITLIASSCKENSTNPPNNGNGIDTTSHNFIWESYTLESPYDISQFLDAVIIDENNIWVGGYIDSINIGIAYNAMHFDGSKWELKKIPYYYHGSYIYSSIKWIFAISENDIWFGNSVHWNGERFLNVNMALSIFEGIGINRMWGNFQGGLYLVGNQGTAAYSSNSGINWQQLNSLTNLDLTDIWGVQNILSSELNVLCVTNDISGEESTSVFQVVNNEVIPFKSEGLPNFGFEGIWSPDGEQWYVCGGELYRLPSMNQSWEKVEGVPSIYMESVRGNSINDIFVTGYLGLIAHWNGSTWYIYSQMPGNYHGLAVKENLVVAVGNYRADFVSGPGTILVGRRN